MPNHNLGGRHLNNPKNRIVITSRSGISPAHTYKPAEHIAAPPTDSCFVFRKAYWWRITWVEIWILVNFWEFGHFLGFLYILPLFIKSSIFNVIVQFFHRNKSCQKCHSKQLCSPWQTPLDAVFSLQELPKVGKCLPWSAYWQNFWCS